MIKNGMILALLLFAGLVASADGQIVVTGSRSADVCPPPRVASDRGANVRVARRERNPYYAARPVYPPVERGARASVNFAPYTSKYYPDKVESYPPLNTTRSIRSR